jgi:hypothetical protein
VGKPAKAEAAWWGHHNCSSRRSPRRSPGEEDPPDAHHGDSCLDLACHQGGGWCRISHPGRKRRRWVRSCDNELTGLHTAHGQGATLPPGGAELRTTSREVARHEEPVPNRARGEKGDARRTCSRRSLEGRRVGRPSEHKSRGAPRQPPC